MERKVERSLKRKHLLKRLYRHGIQLMAVGIITGFVAGVLVTFYNIAAEYIVEYSGELYTLVRENPAFVPLVFVVLAISAFIVGTITKLVPMLRGNGIPQTEGASRGLVKLKWYQTLPTMAATSLFCMFCGLTAGAEGPSMMIGGSCGEGVGQLMHSTDMERRYQITGGACAGIAVAANAPLTGIVFAFEEAHRRFTPAIFICAFSSVLSAIITRELLYQALGLQLMPIYANYHLVEMPIKAYGYVALAGVFSGLLGVGFYKLCMLSRKLFAKITFAKGVGKFLIPFLVAGAFGLITVHALGGGHTLIQSLGTLGGEKEMSLTTIFSSPIVVTLVVVLVLRLVSTILNVGAGVPVGIFIPMLSIGACLGALVAKLCAVMGMSGIYADCIIMITMAAFFASVVKAPITAVILVVELTWEFTLLIPVILGVSIAYMISEIFGIKPIYDTLLEQHLEEQHIKATRQEYIAVIEEGSVAAGLPIRDVLWPSNLLIRSIKRDGVSIVPASDTVLCAGDEITAQAEVYNFDEFAKCVDEIVKIRKYFNISFKRKRTRQIEQNIALDAKKDLNDEEILAPNQDENDNPNE